MNPKKGLIGLFLLVFFLSGIGLSLLIVDDKKDLSSRASQGATVHSLQPAISNPRPLTTSVWNGQRFGLNLSVEYDPNIWSPPATSEAIFSQTQVPTTLRLTTVKLDLDTVQGFLGPDFTKPQLSREFASPLKDWSVESYQFNFFGHTKFVDIWQSSYAVNILAVMSDTSSRSDVLGLLSHMSPTSSGNVRGLSTPDETARLATLVRPSVVMIVNHFCAQAIFDTRQYPFCLAQSGTGFFIHPDGYIATNGHVVSSSPATSIYLSVIGGSLDRLLADFLQSYLSVQTGYPVDAGVVDSKLQEAHSKKEVLYQLAGLVKDMYQKNLISLDNTVSRYYIQLGKTPIQVTKTGISIADDITTATLIASDYVEPDPETGFHSSDVAILKISGSNFPSLPLGSLSDISVGADILVVGFPGLVMGSGSKLLDTSANAEPTFTKGVVSAFKQAKGNLGNLIQTDASINHGNSGGPAVSSDGKVIGIATYGITPSEGGGNYNFLRDIADLKKLMEKNNLIPTTGDTYNSWKNGLNNYWFSYFRYAAKDFNDTLKNYPLHPTANNYLSDATSKIGTPDDKTPSLTRTERRLLINISGALMGLSIIMVIILSISNYVDTKRRNSPVIIPGR